MHQGQTPGKASHAKLSKMSGVSTWRVPSKPRALHTLSLDLQPSQIETDPGQAELLPQGHQVQQGLLVSAGSVAEKPTGGFGW